MRGAVLVALAAAMGNMLQGWDNATIAGAVMYIKKEFNLESQPTIEGLIVAMSLIGATMITTFSGPVSDNLGRRPMLIIASVLYFASGLVMSWAPNVYVLLLGRLLDGFGIGLSVTLIPVYISETAPPEIRGSLNTLPQFSGSGGMLLSYCMVFAMSLTPAPRWRLMLGVLSLPSLIYLALTVFYLPESPRWLVSKGRMAEAKRVLQRLRGIEDVTGEMALLVEGLGVGGDTSLEEYVIGPDEGQDGSAAAADHHIRLYGSQAGASWVAKPTVAGQSTAGMASRHGSMLMDPLVTLFGSVHENFAAGRGSMVFPSSGSMFLPADTHPAAKVDNWDEENSTSDEVDSSDNLRSPLLSRQATSMANDMLPSGDAATTSMSIGGGWQLAYRRSDNKGDDDGGGSGGGLKRIYLHKDGSGGVATGASRRGSLMSLYGGGGGGGGRESPERGSGLIQTSALVSRSAICPNDVMLGLQQPPVQPDAIRPSQTVAHSEGPTWADLFEPGVKRALIVGVGIQLLQQFSGINGVLYYTPQILEQAGVGVLLSNLGIGSDSASLLISALTSFMMLPSIGFAMRLMDVAGRRWLLLSTIPVLVLSLVVLVVGNMVEMGKVPHATVSTVSVVMYFCCFVMGFGPIPNILCSEIFPTRVRGICIAICAMTFWIGDIIVTYTLPVMLNTIGLAGVFSIYAVVCILSWIFVYLKVPETKGMPLEVISEFFALGAQRHVVN